MPNKLTSQYLPHCDGFISNRKLKAMKYKANLVNLANLRDNIKESKELKELRHFKKVNKANQVAMDKVYNGEGMKRANIALPHIATFKHKGLNTRLVVSTNCIEPLQSDKPLHIERHIEKAKKLEQARADKMLERIAENKLEKSQAQIKYEELTKEQINFFKQYGIKF